VYYTGSAIVRYSFIAASGVRLKIGVEKYGSCRKEKAASTISS
jgi:hypothetical protein